MGQEKVKLRDNSIAWPTPAMVAAGLEAAAFVDKFKWASNDGAHAAQRVAAIYRAMCMVRNAETEKVVAEIFGE